MSTDSKAKLMDFGNFLVAAVGYHMMGHPPISRTLRLIRAGSPQLLPKDQVLLYHGSTTATIL